MSWETREQITYDSKGNVFMAFAPARPNMDYWPQLKYADGLGRLITLYCDGGALTILKGVTTVFPAPPTKEDVLKSSRDGSYTRFFPDGSVEQRYNGGELQKWGPPIYCKPPKNWVFIEPCHMCGEYCENCKECRDAYDDSACDFYD